VWNFGSSFVGDGTFTFQDLEGAVYRNRVSDGTNVWKTEGIEGSWTDGQANLGSNGIVYGVANHNQGGDAKGTDDQGDMGCLSAYRLSDGKMLWRQDVPKSPNSVPAVGRLAGHSAPSVVIPIGVNDHAGEQIHVWAFDAETGERQWTFEGPTQTVNMGLGDSHPEARLLRTLYGEPEMTMPNSWGTPAIDGQGTAFVGGTTGHFFALRDTNGDGVVSGPDEVSVLATDADWAGSSGPALAPGLMASGNAKQLFVWKA
jgi:outer membrane protein assembly factor BamB